MVRPLLRFLLLLLLTLGGCFGFLSLDWRPKRAPDVLSVHSSVVSSPIEGGLVAGVAEIDITPTSPLPLAGFAARRGREFESIRDPVHVRALALSLDSGGPPIVIINVDTALIPYELSRKIRLSLFERIVEPLDVVVTATHTHAGPGGIWNNRLASLAGMGSYEADYTDELTLRAAEAAEKAIEGMIPVDLWVTEGEGPPICENRHEHREADRRLQVWSLRAEKETLARLVVFACHPTFLGHRDRRLSAGWPGETARMLDGVTFLFQGAVGDQRPASFSLEDMGIHESADLDLSAPEGRMKAAGRAVASAIVQLEETAAQKEMTERYSLELQSAHLRLPAASGAMIAPPALSGIAGNILARFAPEHTSITLVRIGDSGLLFLPGEVVSELAKRWESAPGIRTVSLSDGYMGYLEVPEALAARRGESAHAYFDEDALDVIDKGVQLLLSRDERAGLE